MTQGLPRQAQFHPVVGGLGFAAGSFHDFARGQVSDQERPAAGTGVAAAAAVGEQMDFDFFAWGHDGLFNRIGGRRGSPGGSC